MSERLFLLLVLFVPYTASAQASPTHGTIIVMDFSDKELVVAADSMGTHGDPSLVINTKPDYSQCKILTFDNQIVFTMVNGMGFQSKGLDAVGSWDARDILRQIVAAEPTTTDLTARTNAIVTKWTNAIADKFRAEYQWHRSDVLRIAEEGKGVLAAGFFFVQPDHGKLQFWNPFVAFNRNLSDPIIVNLQPHWLDCWMCAGNDKVCAAGQWIVVQKFCDAKSERAKSTDGRLIYPNTLLDLGWDWHTLAANRLADLVKAYDATNTVGGSIDVLELDKNGSIRWLARKNECRNSEN